MNQKIMNNMIHKIGFKSKAEDIDSKGRVKIAVNAIGNVDEQMDKSMPGSFNKTLKENMPNIYHYLNHNTNNLIGVPLEGYEEKKHVVMVSQLNLEKSIARDVYSDYKLFAEHNRSLKHSVGVEAMQGKTRTNKGVREVMEWKLYEFSTLTKWPANNETPLLDIKSKDGNIPVEDLIDRLNNTQQYFDMVVKGGYHTNEYIDKLASKLELFQNAIRKHIQAEPHEHSAKEIIENLTFNI